MPRHTERERERGKRTAFVDWVRETKGWWESVTMSREDEARFTREWEEAGSPGLPTPLAEITPYARRILGEQLPEYFPEMAAWAEREPPPVTTAITALAEEAEEIRRVAEVEEEEVGVPSIPTEAPPEGYRWELNELNQWVPVFDPWAAREPMEMSEAERAQLGFTRQREEARAEEERRAFEAQQAQQLWQREQAQRGFGLEQQQFQLQQQQVQQQAEFQAWQQEEAQRQYGAQLAAQPASWLQYAAYTGEQPAIQPWMIPLMGQEYAGTVAGAPIPGWQGDAPTLQDLPELTRPGRQYQARMGPTALAQYQGYQQARTGIRPEETQFRLWAGAPPGGQYQGLRFAR